MKQENHPSTYQTAPNYRPKKDRSYNAIIVMIAAFFLGFGWCVNYYPQTLIPFSTMSKILVFFAVIGFLIPLKFYSKWLHFTKYETILFNILGLAPFLTGFLLLLNYNLPSNKFKHYYSAQIVYEDGKEHLKTIGLKLEQNIFSKNYKVIAIEYPTENDFRTHTFYKLTIYNGFFGVKVIKENVYGIEY